MCSSRTMWKLVPPKPNALTPARRGVPGFTVHGWSFVFTKSGECAKSMPGLWRWQLRLGGRTLSRMASVALRSPAAPAPAFKWPKFDLTDPSAMDCGAGPLRQEQRRAVSHGESIPAVGLGAGARRRQRTDLAELHE